MWHSSSNSGCRFSVFELSKNKKAGVGFSPQCYIKQDVIECRYGGWDGKRWLPDVYVLDTSNFFTLAFHIFFMFIFPPKFKETMFMV